MQPCGAGLESGKTPKHKYFFILSFEPAQILQPNMWAAPFASNSKKDLFASNISGTKPKPGHLLDNKADQILIPTAKQFRSECDALLMQRNTILKSKNFYPDIFPFYDVNKTRIPPKETCETHFLDVSPNFKEAQGVFCLRQPISRRLI